ncbi:MAG: TrkA C-terminal domain-containing protein [Candidatus Gastranaerophilales bacterium]|nr:TrkA C-terminal domain-containing protein [Candidatus Gastranaerophilales bacterium]
MGDKNLKENSIKHSRYINIAIDVAEKIANEEFVENQKIKGRSTLAGGYNVSPETIRKAMTLLAELDVVQIFPNSGVIIKSKDKATDFLNKFSSKENLLSIREKIKKLIFDRNILNLEIDNNIDLILENFTQLKNIELIKHYEYEIKKNSPLINKTISDLKFWQNTGATIVGVLRNNETLISVGPYFSFLANDKILFVGTDDIKLRVQNFCNSLK